MKSFEETGMIVVVRLKKQVPTGITLESCCCVLALSHLNHQPDQEEGEKGGRKCMKVQDTTLKFFDITDKWGFASPVRQIVMFIFMLLFHSNFTSDTEGYTASKRKGKDNKTG